MALKLVCSTDEAILQRSGILDALAAQSKKLDHVALIFNHITHDIEIDEISKISKIINYLIHV